MAIRKKDSRIIVIRISATCERNMVGKVSKTFLEECMNDKDTGMNELRMEIERQEESNEHHKDNYPHQQDWISVDNLCVEDITAQIYTDEEWEPRK
jgi:hypothetical protein